jgi:hypothetical protein
MDIDILLFYSNFTLGRYSGLSSCGGVTLLTESKNTDSQPLSGSRQKEKHVSFLASPLDVKAGEEIEYE